MAVILQPPEMGGDGKEMAEMEDSFRMLEMDEQRNVSELSAVKAPGELDAVGTVRHGNRKFSWAETP